jgi:iron complex transport system substrate-binding protein
MKRILLIPLLLLVAACSPAGDGGGTTVPVVTPTTGATTTTSAPATTTTEAPAFPVTVEADNGPVTIDDEPQSIVSLSTVATEMLFAIGAGDQVVAVDDQSNYPEEAPMTDLSGFTPNVEAILAYEPDLVVISYDPGDLIASLDAQGVPVISYGAAATLDDTYRQIEGLGLATGHAEEAVVVNEQIQTDIDEIVTDTGDVAEGTSYYHEVDNTFYTVTSSTFIGQIYALFGIENIADPADADGAAFGYPQLTGEFIVSADPDLVFLADALYGESVETVSARPGWDAMSAVQSGNIVELDSDVASRWGPRVVDLTRSISDALTSFAEQG